MNQSTRQQKRQRLGLHPNRMTGLVMVSGHGSLTILEIAQRLESLHNDLQLIFVCDPDETLVMELRRCQGLQTWLIITLMEDIPDSMQLADFCISRPDKINISEAIALQLPVITECNPCTLSQERHCAEWIARKRVGIVLPNFKAIDRAVAALIHPENYAHYRANLATLRIKQRLTWLWSATSVVTV